MLFPLSLSWMLKVPIVDPRNLQFIVLPSLSVLQSWSSAVTRFMLLQEKFLKFDWLRAVVFQLNLKYLHVKITNLLQVVVYTNNSMICMWNFKIVSNFTRLTAHEITHNNNFEISLVVFMPNITTTHTITYTNLLDICN